MTTRTRGFATNPRPASSIVVATVYVGPKAPSILRSATTLVVFIVPLSASRYHAFVQARRIFW